MEPLENLCPRCWEPYSDRSGRLRCLYCGYIKPEKATKEEQVLLYDAAQKLRLADFDEARRLYEDVAEQFPKSAEAQWGILLCEYGIKYETDYDGKKTPSCYSTRYESFYENPRYKKAVELADEQQRQYYESQAKIIEGVRKEWIEKASKERPYDIFLSFRDTVDGKRTEDSYDAHNLYNHLTGLGYRVFFSRVTLKDKTGENYEPYIFNALNTAKVMLVYASKPEYVTSTWVKNEWTRYLSRIRLKEKRPDSLCLIVKGFNPSLLPPSLKNRQLLKTEDLTYIKDLEAYLDKELRQSRIEPISEQRLEEQGKDIGGSAVNALGPARKKHKWSKKTNIIIGLVVSSLVLITAAGITIGLLSRSSPSSSVTSSETLSDTSGVVVTSVSDEHGGSKDSGSFVDSFNSSEPPGESTVAPVQSFDSNGSQESNFAENPSLSSDGKTITYGLYPQTRVSNESLISSLDSLTTPGINGWYRYGSAYYAKLTVQLDSDMGLGSTFDDGTVVVSGRTYWFKCEPIVWNVLSATNGNYYIVSSVLLDAHRYNEYYAETKNGHYANNYEYSEIRAWLNDDFYNSAFALGNSNIQTVTVDNSASTTKSSSNPYACNNTQDKVFLPSYQDYINTNYGFSSETGSTNTRCCKTTDWARAGDAKENYDTHNGAYWTRSPYADYSSYVQCVFIDGDIGFSPAPTYVKGICVRPSLFIKIS